MRRRGNSDRSTRPFRSHAVKPEAWRKKWKADDGRLSLVDPPRKIDPTGQHEVP
ncbi:hypothetical protein CLJ1_0029 [Pseudomonas paraeruginosa]|nr:hypothetical protein CLJ1_0029 [Pseudomonas aeruginosa]